MLALSSDTVPALPCYELMRCWHVLALSSDTVPALSCYQLMRCRNGRHKEAAELFKKALAICLKKFPPGHKHIASTMSWLRRAREGASRHVSFSLAILTCYAPSTAPHALFMALNKFRSTLPNHPHGWQQNQNVVFVCILNT